MQETERLIRVAIARALIRADREGMTLLDQLDAGWIHAQARELAPGIAHDFAVTAR